MEEIQNLDAFVGIRTLVKASELHEQLNKPIFFLQDAGVTYRMVLNWDQQGLLEHSREGNGNKWRRYDYVQYIWIKVINELRTFGVPIPIILKFRSEVLARFKVKWLFEVFSLNPELLDRVSGDEAKEELLSVIESKEYESIDDGTSVSLLQLLIAETLTSKVPVSLIVFADGHLITFFENQQALLDPADVHKLTYETHVKVSITNILKTFLTEGKDSFLAPQLAILPDNEKKLLEIIHSGEYEKITINFRDKKMNSFELVKEQDVKRRIVDILQDSKYQDIVIKTHKGVVTKIQNTIKIRLD